MYLAPGQEGEDSIESKWSVQPLIGTTFHYSKATYIHVSLVIEVSVGGMVIVNLPNTTANSLILLKQVS